MRHRRRRRGPAAAVVTAVGTAFVFGLMLTGCGGGTAAGEPPLQETLPQTAESAAPVFEETQEAVSDPWQESAADGEIDFAAQYAIRQDIIGWLYVPGTDIDCPVFASEQSEGVYLSAGSSADMIDFNETLHGPAAKQGDAFAPLYQFADPAFFEDHGEIRYYQPYGTMIYAVMAAWETQDRNLDLSLAEASGEDKDAFLAELRQPAIGKNLQEDHIAEMTSSNFYLTLSAKQGEDADRQFIVVGLLAGVE